VGAYDYVSYFWAQAPGSLGMHAKTIKPWGRIEEDKGGWEIQNMDTRQFTVVEGII